MAKRTSTMASLDDKLEDRDPAERELDTLEAQAKSNPRGFAEAYLRMDEERTAIRSQIQRLLSECQKENDVNDKLTLELKNAEEKIEFLESNLRLSPAPN